MANDSNSNRDNQHWESERHRKRVKSSKRRILDAALLEFSEHGLAGARVDRIAAKSGANKAMIYYHFKNKDDLYREVILRFLEKILSKAANAIREENDLEKQLHLIVDMIDQIYDEKSRPMVPILLRELASGGGLLLKLFAETISSSGLVSRLISIIEQGKREGRLRDIDTRQTIISFISMNQFYLLLSPLVNEIWEIKDEKTFRQERRRAVVDLFLQGIEVK
jgi:AcrR family transcriptional regulator